MRGFAMSMCAALLAALSAPAWAADSNNGRPVIAEVTSDLNGDGIPDRAVMTGPEQGGVDVGLAVFLSRDGRLPAEPTVDRPDLGWTDGLAGNEPSLTTNRRGSLIVRFQNEAVGRDRWSEQLTIAFRNGALVVAGVTHSARDTLDPQAGGTCDINLLSGRGTRDDRPVTLPAGPVPLAAWTDNSLPKACRFD